MEASCRSCCGGRIYSSDKYLSHNCFQAFEDEETRTLAGSKCRLNKRSVKDPREDYGFRNEDFMRETSYLQKEMAQP